MDGEEAVVRVILFHNQQLFDIQWSKQETAHISVY